MDKKVIFYFLKITLLTWAFILAINFFTGFLDNLNINNPLKSKEDLITKTEADKNSDNFVEAWAKDLIIAPIWVAITTNIWTKLKERSEAPANIYSDVMSISYILGNKQIARDKIISQNMIQINEYLNVLKMDLKTSLNQATDRATVLDAYINQLEFRYSSTLENISALKNQRAILASSVKENNTDIEQAKKKMSSDFKIFDSESVIEDVDTYLKARDSYTYARTYIIFIDKFIAYYTYLNNYNKKLLDTLINNKDILVKNSQLVIPDSGSDLLKSLNLIYSEDEFKKQ